MDYKFLAFHALFNTKRKSPEEMTLKGFFFSIQQVWAARVMKSCETNKQTKTPPSCHSDKNKFQNTTERHLKDVLKFSEKEGEGLGGNHPYFTKGNNVLGNWANIFYHSAIFYFRPKAGDHEKEKGCHSTNKNESFLEGIFVLHTRTKS